MTETPAGSNFFTSLGVGTFNTTSDRDYWRFDAEGGDRLTVRLKMDDDKISDIRFEGQGCAISTASASLMTEAVKGKTRAEALTLFERIHQLLTDDAAPVLPELGKLAALSGVRQYPARVKCASLCWHTLSAALQSGGVKAVPAVSTE